MPRRSPARHATSPGATRSWGARWGPWAPRRASSPTLGEAGARALFREQIEGLLEGGIDLVVLETHADLAALLWAVDEARRATDLPILASLTFGEELALPDGTGPAEAASRLAAAGVDAIGVNCGAGPAACLDALEALSDALPGGPPRSIMPNAGPAAAPGGALRLCRGGRLLRGGDPAHAGRRGPDRGRLLRHDAGAHRGDAGRPRRRRGGGRCRPSPARGPAARGPGGAPDRRGRAPAALGRGRARGLRGGRRRAAADAAGRGPGGRPLRRVGRDRPAALDPDRPDPRGGPAPARRPASTREHQRLGDGAGPDGRDGRRLRDPARPGPRVRGPLHDARPEPDGARIGAARRARARGAEHPGTHRRPAADRRLPDRHRRLGRRFDRARGDPGPAQPRRGPGGLADRAAGRVHDRLRPRPDRRRRRRPSGTAWSASSPPVRTS